MPELGQEGFCCVFYEATFKLDEMKKVITYKIPLAFALKSLHTLLLKKREKWS